MRTTTLGDPYQRRREAGAASREDTRRRLLTAADALFRELGYPARSAIAVTVVAGVSLQTLYLAWGAKSALFRAAADAAAGASDLPLDPEAWHEVIHASLADDVAGDPTARAYLAAVSRLFVQVAQRTAPYWRMQAAAGAADPDIAAGHTESMARRRTTMAGVAARIPHAGLLPGLTPTAVADTVWALASPDVFNLLTTQASYSAADVEAWLTRTLTSTLCTND
jgi:AcrR family transcriptional regulator